MRKINFKSPAVIIIVIVIVIILSAITKHPDFQKQIVTDEEILEEYEDKRISGTFTDNHLYCKAKRELLELWPILGMCLTLWVGKKLK